MTPVDPSSADPDPVRIVPRLCGPPEQPRRPDELPGASPPVEHEGAAGVVIHRWPMSPNESEHDNDRPPQAIRSPGRPAPLVRALGEPRATSTPTRRAASRPTASSSRRRTSPGRCTWATRSTTRSRTSSSAGGGCRASTPSGCPAPTTPASPRRPSSRGGCSRKRRRPATTSAARRWSSASGPGRTSTRPASSSQLRLMGCSCDWDRTRFTLDEVCSPRRARDVLQPVQGRPDLPRQTAGQLGHPAPHRRGRRRDLLRGGPRAPLDDQVPRGRLRPAKSSTSPPPGPRRCSATPPSPCIPDDPRYQHLIGKTVELPLTGRDIPIIADGLLVDPAFGTGS